MQRRTGASGKETKMPRTSSLLAACAMLMTVNAARAESWDMYVVNSVATVPTVRNEMRMIEQIDAATNHALQIRLHLGGSLQINTTTVTQAVGDGVVQMADDVFFSGAVPIADVPRLPMLIRSQEEYARIAPIMEPYIAAAYAKRGVLLLGSFVYPVQVAFARKKLTSLDDIKGMKMRVTSPEQGELVKRFGGIPITMGVPEVPAALDRGVIDGVFTASAGAGYPWKDLLKYNYRLGVNYVNAFIIVNKAAFDKLTPEVQTILRKTVAGNMDKFTADMLAEEDSLTRKMQDGGMVVTPGSDADAAEAIKRMQPQWDEWAKAHGPDAVAAVAAVRAALGR
jgi:TRAP-type C4-dicarboxylate transport system substrate-binding protein